jgi:hypothetical protein
MKLNKKHKDSTKKKDSNKDNGNNEIKVESKSDEEDLVLSIDSISSADERDL